MLKNKLYENLDGYQLRILEGALNGTVLEDAHDNEVYLNVQEHEYETHREYGAVLNEEAQDNFNEVYRYLNSQGEDEEIRKEKLVDYVQKEYRELQATIDKYIEEGKLTPKDIFEYGIGTENCMLNHAEIKFGFKGCDINLGLDFHGIDDLIEENVFDLVKADNEKIEKRSKFNKAYDLLNKLYNAVPESYTDKIYYGSDHEDNGEEKAGETIFFDDIALGTIDDIKDIGCLNGKLCGREDSETTEFDKHINIDCIGTYRNIFFTYKGNSKYKCEMTPELEKGKIHNKKCEMIKVMEVVVNE